LKKDIQKIYDERTKIRIKMYENTKIGISNSNSNFNEHNNKFLSQLKEKRIHIQNIQEELNNLKENN
jgi:hypothetical protein